MFDIYSNIVMGDSSSNKLTISAKDLQTSRGAILVRPNAKLTLNPSVIIEKNFVSGSGSNSGGAIYVNGGVLNVNGAIISQNRTKFGGGIYVTGNEPGYGTININAGSISNNIAEKGGAIYIANNAKINMNGGEDSGAN